MEQKAFYALPIKKHSNNFQALRNTLKSRNLSSRTTSQSRRQYSNPSQRLKNSSSLSFNHSLLGRSKVYLPSLKQKKSRIQPVQIFVPAYKGFKCLLQLNSFQQKLIYESNNKSYHKKNKTARQIPLPSNTFLDMQETLKIKANQQQKIIYLSKSNTYQKETPQS